MKIDHDDRACPHCDGANTGHYISGKHELYTTRIQRADGFAVYACCAANRERCPNFRAVQILREREGTSNPTEDVNKFSSENPLS